MHNNMKNQAGESLEDILRFIDEIPNPPDQHIAIFGHDYFLIKRSN